MADGRQTPRVPTKTARYFRIAIVLAILVALNFGGAWLAHQIDAQFLPQSEPAFRAIVLAASLAYVVLMAAPFVPGMEIGLAIMVVLGSQGAVLVYLCTLAALSLSYAIGWHIPHRHIVRLLSWLHLHRAAALVREIEPLDLEDRLALLYREAPSRIAPFLLRHRYVAIAIVLNMPGNTLIGGGGGIALVIGMSRIIPFHSFLAVLALAVAPIPLWFFLRWG